MHRKSGRRVVVLIFAIVIAMPQLIYAQTYPNAGILPFSTHVGQYDLIDAYSGNVMLTIPIMSKTGKIPFSFSLIGNYRPFGLDQTGNGCPGNELLRIEFCGRSDI